MSSISFDSYDDIYLMSSGDLDVTSNFFHHVLEILLVKVNINSIAYESGQGRVQKSYPVPISDR